MTIKTNVLLTVFAAGILIATAHLSLGNNLEGKVTSVSGQTTTIALDRNAAPAVGDEVEIYFKLAGVDDEVSVGRGKITRVNGGTAEATITQSTGVVSKDQLAHIKSTTTASASPVTKNANAVVTSLLGDWTATAPDNSKVSFSFKEDGSLLWLVEESDSTVAISGKYRIDNATTPRGLEIFDVNVGELKGETLRGPFEIQPDGRLKLDLSQRPGEEVRFTERDTIFFSRSATPIVRPTIAASPSPGP